MHHVDWQLASFAIAVIIAHLKFAAGDKHRIADIALASIGIDAIAVEPVRLTAYNRTLAVKTPCGGMRQVTHILTKTAVAGVGIDVRLTAVTRYGVAVGPTRITLTNRACGSDTFRGSMRQVTHVAAGATVGGISGEVNLASIRW